MQTWCAGGLAASHPHASQPVRDHPRLLAPPVVVVFEHQLALAETVRVRVKFLLLLRLASGIFSFGRARRVPMRRGRHLIKRTIADGALAWPG